MCYNVIQTLLFAVLAVLIMRLKLFLTPHLTVTAGLLCSKKVTKHRGHGTMQRKLTLCYQNRN